MAVYYSKVPVGSKTFITFMSDLSRKRDLDQIYTNHSIRVTGATILSKEMYGPSQTMAVVGHKSVQSLTVYPRVDEEEKIRMGHSISDNNCFSVFQLALPASSSQPSTEPKVVPVPQSADCTKYLEDICLNKLFDDFVNSSVNVFYTAIQTNQIKPTVLSNCQFTININVSKQ